ncbi:hypothetical protein NFHSH190041_13130 [Shewanella sp. NFH-SH190041]|uniref:DUF4381 domain-containing protein n=1 Tax=Shewanella sp. NFH-SH190041 TaxID=2950245 RepID=UPI0021C3B151|nr:DUF4381 domain-containing protein [Shewanella sp. NFH-SH190041]BDM63861.1 hypothetical protein NFHSH190041_13130 [Shewanella sp. NFH-SH190041]
MTATPLIASHSSPAANPALAALQDIHLPEPVGLWPLAPGYWILLALLLVIVLGLIFFTVRRHKRLAARRMALALLDRLQPNQIDYATEVNTLMKRAALSYLPRTQVAALEGEPWYHLLDSAMPSAQQGKLAALLQLRFSGKPLSPQQASELDTLARIWLKRAIPFSAAEQQKLAKEALC